MIADYAVSPAENGWHDRWSAARQAQREKTSIATASEQPRSRRRPPRARPRLEPDSATVRLQSSSRTRGDSYLNNHFSDSQLDFQIGFILWPPTAFLSYLFYPCSTLLSPPHSHSHFPFIFPLARFNCLFDLWPRETFKRPTRLDLTRLVSDLGSDRCAPHLPTSLSCGEAWAWSWASATRSVWALGAARGDLLLASFNWKRCM